MRRLGEGEDAAEKGVGDGGRGQAQRRAQVEDEEGGDAERKATEVKAAVK